MAAVLACGEAAVLSHATAAALWGLLRPTGGPVHVTIPLHSGRARATGIRLHRCVSLGIDDVTVRNGIPATTVPQTIVDVRATLPTRLFRRAVRQAEIAGFALGPGVVADRTRSDFEGHFRRLCRRAGLPDPEVNVKIGHWTVDFLWPARLLAVETDSYAFHRGSVAFEDDHARDLDLRARGYDVRRFTEHQVYEETDRVVADLRAALARGG